MPCPGLMAQGMTRWPRQQSMGKGGRSLPFPWPQPQPERIDLPQKNVCVCVSRVDAACKLRIRFCVRHSFVFWHFYSLRIKLNSWATTLHLVSYLL